MPAEGSPLGRAGYTHPTDSQRSLNSSPEFRMVITCDKSWHNPNALLLKGLLSTIRG